MGTEESFQAWSTLDIPESSRFDYWMSVMRTALWPVTQFSGYRNDFRVELNASSLGRISTLRERICAHEAQRTRVDVERTEERSYHLFVSLSQNWAISQNGLHASLRRGDVVMVGEGEHRTCVTEGFDGVILKCPVDWVRSWLPEPEGLVGRRISRDSKWGQVLSQIVMEMTPEMAVAAPLPASVLTDQLGVILALNADEIQSEGLADLLQRILQRIRERCTEVSLDAGAVAQSLSLPVAVVHRALGGRGLTFVAVLASARIDCALAILRNPGSAGLTAAEIAGRVGFSTPQYFTRVLRQKTGHTLAELRYPRSVKIGN